MKPYANQFLGITTMGEKGQVVIPAEARARMKLKTGDKLIVMNPHDGAVVFVKASQFEAFAQTITKRLASMQKTVKSPVKKK